MKAKALFPSLAALTMLISAPVFAHEVPNIDHSHAFQQTGYGTYRQGHYVNGPQGSIVIWSPRTYTGYQKGAVKFARPTPITRAPGSPVSTTRDTRKPETTYGTR